MSTGRRASITEDADALVMTVAAASHGELPAFTTGYTRDALIVSGWLDPAMPDRLTPDGLAEARRWVEIKSTTAVSIRRTHANHPGEPS